jgi:transposase InsO family protein
MLDRRIVMTASEHHDINRKLRVLNHAIEGGNVSQTCRYFGISRETFYQWRRAYERDGERALINSKPCPQNPKLRTPAHIEEKILHLRKTYHLGQLRIKWYLERYHGIRVSSGAVYYVLKRNGLNRLPRNAKKRSPLWQRYEKPMPGHHMQVDVKFLNFGVAAGKTVRRFQYTAIDDATRIRALKVYEKHTQANAIDFVNYVVEKFPFRISTIRTDNGHEFQLKFRWHVEDLGIQHQYIKVRTPRLNGKVERSHRTDKEEFYQLLTYTDDVNLNLKLEEWQNFYNYHRPHRALSGKTPYELLREKMNLNLAEARVE